MASKREERQAEVRLRVIRLISKNPEMSSRQIADKAGISNGSAYYVLAALVDKGFMKLENFKNNPRKGQYAHFLTPRGIREKSLLTHLFIDRKWQEFDALRAEIAALKEEVGMSVDAESSEWRIK